MADLFHRISERASRALGSPWAFVLAILAVVAWALTGPLFGYGDAEFKRLGRSGNPPPGGAMS